MRHLLLRNMACPLVATAIVYALCQSVAAAEKYELKVVTDRPDAIYKAGEEATFLISLTKDGKPLTGENGETVMYRVDDFISSGPDYPKGKLTVGSEPATVKVTSDKPGFLRCIVTMDENKQLTKTAGAAFSPLEIQPSLPAPADFDEFWAEQKRKLAEVPAKAKLTPVEQSNLHIECFDLQVDCLGGAPVSGYLGKPKNAKPNSLPAILWVHGAGVRSSSLANAVKGANEGMLSLDINAHGLPNGKSADFYREQFAGPLRGYPHFGRENRETTYFVGMFLRLIRAMDYLTSQPEWDGKTLIVIGHSQGGGQALAAGGLNERVSFIASGVPAICDHSGRAAGRINGWPKLVTTLPDGTPAAEELKAAQYVDGVNFASRCKADAIMSVGFIDVTCPPSSCYAAYNQLKGKKQVINKPLMGHAAPSDIQKAFFNAVKAHMKEQVGK
ncbi:MAG: acetylxylan esterase [Planctomycetaceae bacterium]|nr:acetylxylan esterase [Planctomycetaceae bacterium]